MAVKGSQGSLLSFLEGVLKLTTAGAKRAVAGAAGLLAGLGVPGQSDVLDGVRARGSLKVQHPARLCCSTHSPSGTSGIRAGNLRRHQHDKALARLRGVCLFPVAKAHSVGLVVRGRSTSEKAKLTAGTLPADSVGGTRAGERWQLAQVKSSSMFPDGSWKCAAASAQTT